MARFLRIDCPSVIELSECNATANIATVSGGFTAIEDASAVLIRRSLRVISDNRTMLLSNSGGTLEVLSS